ncbi:MAG: DUF805 domain-containing protein [Mesorhizobium sp.]|nr:DUF805 domain-containing protein [Mesorhizobium sp.]MBL8579408.1 DUF805 domain-containing protein [Mesorhizobium sp.]
MHFLFGFSGRIGRGMWWLGQLVPILVWVAVIFSFGAVVQVFDPSSTHEPGELSSGGLTLLLAILIGCVTVTWINIAVCVKRYHDLNKSGWWYLINFVPIIGPIWLVIECGFLAGWPGSNRFGPPPGSGLDSDVDDLRSWQKVEEKLTASIGRTPSAPVPHAARSTSRPIVSGKPAFGRRA